MNLATSEAVFNHYALLWWQGQELVKELTGLENHRGVILDAKKDKEKSHEKRATVIQAG